MRGLALGLALAALIVSCMSSAPPIVKPPRWDLVQQQTALWTQIRDWRREAGLRVDPSPDSMLALQGKPTKEVRKICPEQHPIKPVCEDVCSLATAICDNAESICNIADQLGKDDIQAQEKCTSAKASCKEAQERCCTKCSEEPKEPKE